MVLISLATLDLTITYIYSHETSSLSAVLERLYAIRFPGCIGVAVIPGDQS